MQRLKTQLVLLLEKKVEDSGFPSVVVDPHGAKKDMLEGEPKRLQKSCFPKESGAAINEFEENEALLGTLFPWGLRNRERASRRQHAPRREKMSVASI